MWWATRRSPPLDSFHSRTSSVQLYPGTPVGAAAAAARTRRSQPHHSGVVASTATARCVVTLPRLETAPARTRTTPHMYRDVRGGRGCGRFGVAAASHPVRCHGQQQTTLFCFSPHRSYLASLAARGSGGLLCQLLAPLALAARAAARRGSRALHGSARRATTTNARHKTQTHTNPFEDHLLLDRYTV